MVKANDDGASLACLGLAHAQVENKIPARPRRAPRRGAREYRRVRALPIWGIHIQTKSTFICGINGVGGGGVVVVVSSQVPTRTPACTKLKGLRRRRLTKITECMKPRMLAMTNVSTETAFFDQTRPFASIS